MLQSKAPQNVLTIVREATLLSRTIAQKHNALPFFLCDDDYDAYAILDAWISYVRHFSKSHEPEQISVALPARCALSSAECKTSSLSILTIGASWCF